MKFPIFPIVSNNINNDIVTVISYLLLLYELKPACI